MTISMLDVLKHMENEVDVPAGVDYAKIRIFEEDFDRFLSYYRNVQEAAQGEPGNRSWSFTRVSRMNESEIEYFKQRYLLAGWKDVKIVVTESRMMPTITITLYQRAQSV